MLTKGLLKRDFRTCPGSSKNDLKNDVENDVKNDLKKLKLDQ